jgi:hypothetical protein
VPVNTYGHVLFLAFWREAAGLRDAILGAIAHSLGLMLITHCMSAVIECIPSCFDAYGLTLYAVTLLQSTYPWCAHRQIAN